MVLICYLGEGQAIELQIIKEEKGLKSMICDAMLVGEAN